jgi:hopene-associated glycosyltransferase HpnB
MIALALGLLALAIWLYLLVARGGFWETRENDGPPTPTPAAWPPVAAVVPARNEADVIARSVGSLLAQDYPGPFKVILVDDESDDGTAEAARAAAAQLGAGARLEVLRGTPLPAGWTGKVWAMSQGIAHAEKLANKPEHLLLTDADIAHAPDNLRSLVARAEHGGFVLTSLMAELHCETWPERLLIPAFVLFFQMLYPFRWVNQPRRRLAAAAGGCMLARREALTAAGGVAQIKSAIIDDCAMGALMKRQGPIWLGLTHRATSIRPYVTVGETGKMIYRSAYAQLGYSVWVLAGTLAALAIMFIVPPALSLFAIGPARGAGIGGWAAMAFLFQPMLRFYRRSPLWGLAMPLIGVLYASFTLRSAIEFWRGRGGMWKGRAQAIAGAA